jgi:hypothetical protein
MAIRLHGQIIANRNDLQLAMGNGLSKTTARFLSPWRELSSLERWRARR